MEWNGLEWFDDGYYIMITCLVCWRDGFVLSFTFLVDVEYNTVFLLVGWHWEILLLCIIIWSKIVSIYFCLMV
jgi:hypothetical protein